MNIYLQLPVFDIEGITRGLSQRYIMNLKKEEVLKMQSLIQEHNEIVCYTDGSSLKNPGYSGASAVFCGRRGHGAQTQILDSSDLEVIEEYNVDNDQKDLERIRFHTIMRDKSYDVADFKGDFDE